MDTPQPTPAPVEPTPGDTLVITRDELDRLVDARVDQAVQTFVDNMPEAELAATDGIVEAPRYAVYDTTYLRFDGPVFDKRTEATKHAKDAGLKTGAYEVREV